MAVILGLWCGLALADAIDPDPECPDGTTPHSSHSGRWCAPATCPADGVCPAGTCTEVEMCVHPETHSVGGGRLPDEGTYEVLIFDGACGFAGACDVGQCETVRVCRTSMLGGCGCATLGAVPVGFAVIALAGALSRRVPS